MASTVMHKKKPHLLANLPAGCRAKVSSVEGCGDLRAKLSAMGFTPQAEVEVLECSCGKQIIKIRGGTLILDDDTACKVACSLENDEQGECKKTCGTGKFRHRLRRFAQCFAKEPAGLKEE